MDYFNDKNTDYYRKLIVKHYNNPNCKGLIKSQNSLVFHHFANSCVDDFFIELTFDKKIIKHAKFEGIGCSISTSSIDIFCNLITNKNIKNIFILNQEYKKMLRNEKFNEETINDLLSFKNVWKQPNRVKCALIISESIDEIIKLWEQKNG